jgi:hypothetical protein
MQDVNKRDSVNDTPLCYAGAFYSIMIATIATFVAVVLVMQNIRIVPKKFCL